jgi:predicted AAA+ superfamily ATPase
MNESFERLIARVETLITRIESVLPQPLSAPDWHASVAFRYRKRSSGHGSLEPVMHLGTMGLDDLKEIDEQKDKIRRNTEPLSPSSGQASAAGKSCEPVPARWSPRTCTEARFLVNGAV